MSYKRFLNDLQIVYKFTYGFKKNSVDFTFPLVKENFVNEWKTLKVRELVNKWITNNLQVTFG